MTINGQRTMYGIHVELSRLLGKEYTPLANTTLNEKFDIIPNIELADSLYPTLGYYAIGVGGDPIIVGNPGYTYSKHSPVDAALFKHVPFLMRTLTNDLSNDERSAYRLRVIETINNVDYACYYLKAIPLIELRDYFYKIVTVNDETVLRVFTTDTDKLLNPVPQTRSVDTTDITTSNYVTNIAKLKFALTLTEMEDLKTVFSLRGISELKITEIGLVMGIDQTQADGLPELAVAQISHHVEVSLDLAVQLANAESIVRAIEIGGSEPLLL